MLERAEKHEASDPFTGAVFRVQFWDTHTEDRWGKRRMAFAVWQQNPTFPSTFHLLKHGRDFWPSPTISCDGPEAARHLLGFILSDITDDICEDELEITPCDD